MAVDTPKWEFGGTYDRALKGVQRIMYSTTEDQQLHRIAYDIYRLLGWAHVATMDIEQYKALPIDLDDLDEHVDPHLPFNLLYVSVGDSMFAGTLLMTPREESKESDKFGAVTFWNMDAYQDMPDAGVAMPIGLTDFRTRTYLDIGAMIMTDIPGPEEVWEHKDSEVVGLHQTLNNLKVIRFLQSANVDLETTPVTRQVRRQAERKGYNISSRVYVRSPRHPRNPIVSGDHINFSHRFEVRGHYKHYSTDTRLFKATKRDQPHKIMNHPTRGEVVRIWCPNFVKGPEDKPLVPKTRVYKEFEKKE